MFEKCTIAKYAYLYTVQQLQEGAPSFFLACVGTDNRFTAAEVLQKWNYIHTELKKHGIQLLSFASDGDSRLLHAMRVVMNMTTADSLSQQNLHKKSLINFPASLHRWVYVKQVPTVLCVQDTVHIGVKLKSRLLKPSIILPLGMYVATSSHLRILIKTLSKARHGLRLMDLDHHDKQNFAAVEHIINASQLLHELPDAVGTKQYIGIIHSVVNSYLNKGLRPEERLHEIWFAVFFLRYWRQWILNHPCFTLKENFITTNAFMCIEINAHTLLMCILCLREGSAATSFVPWMLGSQTCERMFRALRSMTSTFSTIINFSMLGLLQRLHKLFIQEELQSQTSRAEHDISFLRQDTFGEQKDGISSYVSFSVSDITDEMILDALQSAETKAKESMEMLGMSNDLKKHKHWDTPTLADCMRGVDENKTRTESDDEENEEEDINDANLQLTDDHKQLIKDLEKLQNHKVVDRSVKQRAKNALSSKEKFQPFDNLGIPLYKNKDDSHTDPTTANSLFLEVDIDKRDRVLI